MSADAARADAPYLIGCGPASVEVPPPARIGSKAHNLARMAQLGLPVPAAFVIGTGWCARPDALEPAVWKGALAALEAAAGLRFGDAARPLLLSVRSGASVSMPGMMDTLLNVGLNDETVEGVVRQTGNPRLAWDAYRRHVAGYGEVVLGVAPSVFEEDLARVAAGCGERELDFAQCRQLARLHLDSVRRESGRAFPQDAGVQLREAIDAVFRSWHSAKAKDYRRLQRIDDRVGTAVTVQRMVFGNAGGASGAGVGFTRHPSSGEPVPWVDFLFNAQGEDVVSGRRTAGDPDALAVVAPRVWQHLLDAAHALETEFRDMQDFEFTVEEGRLYLLQSRAGKRTPRAAARIALDLLEEGVIDRQTALERTAALDDEVLWQTCVVSEPGDGPALLTTAQSACSGVATGEIALDAERAQARHAAGASVVLVRQDADTGDIAPLEISAGLLTQRGARTSHAAVVARQLGKVCLVGCESMQIDMQGLRVSFGDRVLEQGDAITLDGNSGQVLLGAAKIERVRDEALARRLAELRGG